MTPFSLFAITDDSRHRIVRVPLASYVQIELTALFAGQEEAFNLRAESEIPFDGRYKPDDTECLVIDDYDDIDDLQKAIESPISLPEIEPSPSTFAGIRALFSGRIENGEAIALIQSFDKRRIISPTGKFMLFFNENVYQRFDNVGISVDDKLSTILTGKKLRFFSFYAARHMFDLTQYFRDATEIDLKAFIGLTMVHCKDEALFMSNSDNLVRRKVAFIRQSGVLENVSIVKIKDVARSFGLEIPVETINGTEVIVLPDSKAELKKLLRFLDEDYYSSSLLSKPHITNSKIPLSG